MLTLIQVKVEQTNCLSFEMLFREKRSGRWKSIQQFTHFQRPFSHKPFSTLSLGSETSHCLWIAPRCVVLCIDICRIYTMKFRFKYRYRWDIGSKKNWHQNKPKKPWHKRLVWSKTTRKVGQGKSSHE